MKKILLALLILMNAMVFAQGKTLYIVDMIKVKPGMKTAFETAWKNHVARFHNANDKRQVFEIVTGPNIGGYLIVEGPVSYADMDIVKTNAKAHAEDLEKNIAPTQEIRLNGIYRNVDTLSYNGNIQSEKALVTVTHVKNGKMADYMAEARKAVIVLNKNTRPFSNNVMVQLFSGSDPVYVSIRNLKDGLKELEDNYGGMTMSAFKDDYIKEYGQAAWDSRIKLQTDEINSRDVYVAKARKDLSSK
jgi:hypothetical protein